MLKDHTMQTKEETETDVHTGIIIHVLRDSQMFVLWVICHSKCLNLLMLVTCINQCYIIH
jgi:hypothetical protein